MERVGPTAYWGTSGLAVSDCHHGSTTVKRAGKVYGHKRWRPERSTSCHRIHLRLRCRVGLARLVQDGYTLGPVTRLVRRYRGRTSYSSVARQISPAGDLLCPG